MPTKLPEASVYSKGLNTVSVAMVHFLPVASVVAAPEEAVSAASEEAAVEDAPPQAARDRAMTEATPNASSFFMRYFPFHSTNFSAAARRADAGTKKGQ